MLGQGTTIFPDNLAVGTAGDEAFPYRQGVFEARELRRLGVDVNFGPSSTSSPIATAPTSESGRTARIRPWSLATVWRASRACRRAEFRPAPSTFPARATRPSTPT